MAFYKQNIRIYPIPSGTDVFYGCPLIKIAIHFKPPAYLNLRVSLQSYFTLVDYLCFYIRLHLIIWSP